MVLKPGHELNESRVSTFLRLEHVRQARADDAAAVANVERHRQELARIRREAAGLTERFESTQKKHR
jgi:hypothetical protein